MRVVFIGTVELSRRVLEHLLTMHTEIVGVCTLQTSKFNADHVDLSVLSKKHGIPCIYVEDINSDDVLVWIQDKAPDVIFCFGWSKLLKQDLLTLAPLGVVGFHPAMLPVNRGRHPLIWALVLGLERTASTFFFMDIGADTGDILSQREIKIADTDDAGELYEKVIQTALEQIEEFVPLLIKGVIKRKKQDHSIANSWRKRGPVDGKIDWRMSAKSIHNLVRGLSKPYVGADFMVDGQEIKVWKTVVVDVSLPNIEPGKVLMLTSAGPVVKCGDDAVCLLVTEPKFEPLIGSYL